MKFKIGDIVVALPSHYWHVEAIGHRLEIRETFDDHHFGAVWLTGPFRGQNSYIWHSGMIGLYRNGLDRVLSEI
jgi:hypothetical protein